MEWVKEGVDYWDNPDCPTEYLEGALVELIDFVEGVSLPVEHFKGMGRSWLIEQVARYEYLADK